MPLLSPSPSLALTSSTTACEEVLPRVSEGSHDLELNLERRLRCLPDAGIACRHGFDRSHHR